MGQRASGKTLSSTTRIRVQQQLTHESHSTHLFLMANRIRPKLVLPAYPGRRIHREEWSFGTNRQQKSGFIENAYFNGLGRHVCQLQRLTIKFSKSSGTSSGVRDFIENDLIDFARSNPGIALYLKPRMKPTPVLNADYLNGTTHWFSLRLFSRTQVKQWIEYFVTRSGQQVQRFRKPIKTDCPSVQGHWTPFMHIPGHVKELPDDERAAFVPSFPSATEQLRRLQQQVHNLHILHEHRTTGDQ